MDKHNAFVYNSLLKQFIDVTFTGTFSHKSLHVFLQLKICWTLTVRELRGKRKEFDNEGERK
jgi:hypothetical protein